MPEPGFTFAIPGDPDLPTGGYAYDRRLAADLRARGLRVDLLRLPDGFPVPDDAARAQAAARLAALPAGETVMIDGLALGVLPEAAAAVADRGRLIALVHHPLALETGTSPERAAALQRSERAALAAAAGVVVTSPATADILVRDYAVPVARLVVAAPGTDPAPPARGSAPGEPVRLLAVGTLVARKGHGDLLAALARLDGALPDWRLDIVGSDSLDPGHAATLRETVERLGLGGRVRLAGAVGADALAGFYDAADLFVLASHYEGYGMAYAEAIAHGLPVVGTTGGAVADAVRAAAVLVPPGDVDALAAALRPLVADPAERARRAALSRAASATLPTWSDAADAVQRLIEDRP